MKKSPKKSSPKKSSPKKSSSEKSSPKKSSPKKSSFKKSSSEKTSSSSIKKIYNQLIVRYDAKDLLQYSDKIQKRVLSYAKENKNKILVNLINNLSSPMNKIKYLAGPNSVDVMIKDQTKIYLIGEADHSNKTTCDSTYDSISVVDFFNEILQQSTCFIDIYLELNLKERIRRKMEFTLDEINKNLKKCIPLKNKCNYNGRLHTVDVRFLKNSKYSDEQFDLLKFHSKLSKVKNVSQKNKVFTEFHSFIKEFELLTTQLKLFNYLKKKFKTNSLLKKELKKSNLNQTELINELLYDLPTPEMYSFSQLLKKNKKSTYFKQDDIYVILHWLMFIGTIFMDIYTLSRMFKTYDSKKCLRNHHPQQSYNMIYYAGNYHTNLAKQYLLNTGFTCSKSITSTDLSCVDMSLITQPFF